MPSRTVVNDRPREKLFLLGLRDRRFLNQLDRRLGVSAVDVVICEDDAKDEFMSDDCTDPEMESSACEAEC